MTIVKVSIAELDPIAKALVVIEKDTATDTDLLGLNEDEITDILNELYTLNTEFDKIRKSLKTGSLI